MSETIVVTVTAVTEDIEEEGASIAIFTVTGLPERPFFSQASYTEELVRKNSFQHYCDLIRIVLDENHIAEHCP